MERKNQSTANKHCMCLSICCIRSKLRFHDQIRFVSFFFGQSINLFQQKWQRKKYFKNIGDGLCTNIYIPIDRHMHMLNLEIENFSFENALEWHWFNTWAAMLFLGRELFLVATFSRSFCCHRYHQYFCVRFKCNFFLWRCLLFQSLFQFVFPVYVTCLWR